MTENELALLQIIREHKNREAAIQTAITIILDFLREEQDEID